MSLRDRIKFSWKKEFACEVPDELVSRLEFHKCNDNPEAKSKQNTNEVLSSALNRTRDVINDLRLRLQQEEFMLTFLTNEIESVNSAPAVKLSEGHNGETETGDVYAQVSKTTDVNHDESEPTTNKQAIDCDSLKCNEANMVYDEVAVEESSGPSRPGSIKIQTNSCAPPKKRSSGSVSAKIKMFQRKDSSGEESAEDGTYARLSTKARSPTRPLPPTRTSAAARHQQKHNEYEEIILPSVIPDDMAEAESPSNVIPSNPGIDDSLSVTTNTDTNIHHSVKEECSTSIPKQSKEFISQAKVDLYKPPVPRRTSSNAKPPVPPPPVPPPPVPPHHSNVLKHTEETLKQSDKEPSFSSSVKGIDIKVSVRSKFKPVDILTNEDAEGDYCSIADLQRNKHVTLVQVRSGGSDKSDGGSDPEISKNVIVLGEKKSESLLKSHESKKIDNDLEHFDTCDETTEPAEKMNKFFNKKSGESFSELNPTGDGPVIEEAYKSLSSSESEEEVSEKHVPIITYTAENSPTPNVSESAVRKSRRHVPDYEYFNFDTLLTKPGISAADSENMTDTGSEDDAMSCDESLSADGPGLVETPSGQSDDSGMYDSMLGETSNQSGGFAMITTQIDPEELRKISMESRASTDSRISTSSFVTVETRDLFIPRLDSIDGPCSPMLQHDRGHDRKGSDYDDISVCSVEPSQLEKAEEEETLTQKREKLRNEQLRMRHIVVKGILQSERSYLHDIEQLVKGKVYLQQIAMNNQSLIAPQDVTTIFYMLDEIFQKHREFVDDLESKVNSWTHDQSIGSTFKLMVLYFKIYEDYVTNYPRAIERIQYYQDNEEAKQLLDEQMEPFKDETIKLEDILLKPIHRMQRNTLLLHDLVKHTPDDHPDYMTLTKALKLSELNLKTYNTQPGHVSSKSVQESRQLVRSGFVVEVSRDKKCTRHIRYIFLFSDILICTKHKANSSKHKDGSFKVLWSLPISTTLKIHVKGDRVYELNESLDDLKMKIGNLKVELREEMLHKDGHKDKTFSIAQRKTARAIDRLKKKINEQEATLVEALPRLPLNLEMEGQRAHTLLFASDYERVEWREAINSLRQKYEDSAAVQLSVHDMEAMTNSSKFHPQVNGIGTALLSKDEEILNGSLNVTIHKLQGLDDVCDTYCCLELDSYGHFYKQAQTRVTHNDVDAAWDQDFEINLDASQTLRILCYKKQPEDTDDSIVGKCALELSLTWLHSKFNEKTITMNDISLTISIRHTPASKTLKRAHSRLMSGVFGVSIQKVTKRETKTVPTIVTTCVQQIEKRGLHELGIYRVSGVTSDIQHLKKLFDKNPIAASAQVETSDIHAVTGVLKLYFRELPEPVFTDQHYQNFIQAIELSDEEAKEKCMLSLLHALPEANYYTIVYMVEHLVRVSQQSFVNKMSANNLAMIYGPTFLHPATSDSNENPMLQMAMAAKDASIQCEIIHFFIKLATSGKNLRKSATPNS